MIYVEECFASRSFIVSGLTLRSLIHFEFIFVQKNSLLDSLWERERVG